MKKPPGVSPSNGYQGTTRGKEKILMTSVGIEPTTSRLDLPLLCRPSYEAGQRKSGTIKVVDRGEEKVRVHTNVMPRKHYIWTQILCSSILCSFYLFGVMQVSALTTCYECKVNHSFNFPSDFSSTFHTCYKIQRIRLLKNLCN